MTGPERTPAWAARLGGDLDAADRRATALLGGLSSHQLNWKPAEDVWSVGQCLQHLHVANEVYVPPIAAALDGAARQPVGEITLGWFGRWFIRNYIEPSSETRRARAPGKIAPGAHVELSLLDDFLRSNAAARDVIRRAGACDVNRIRFRNPFIPLLRFTVGTGLTIVTAHQRRHLLQAEGIRQSAGFPAQ